MNWKPALYEYVRAANERESDFAAFVRQERDVSPEERLRLRRTKESLDERGAIPLGSETKATIRQVRENGRDVTADLHLRKTVQYRTNGVEHVEERVERERVALQETPAGEWRVVRAEPIVQERIGGGAPFGTLWDAEAPRPRTVPYLNERVLVRPHSEEEKRAGTYDREAARAYAERHWNDPNPQYIHFDVDCTNYVSQCLYAGGAPMNYTGVRESGWWYKGRSGGRELWSFSWSVAHALQLYLSQPRRNGLAAERVSSPRELTVGDVVCYDFDGDGRFEHNAIVTGADGAGMPLVNAHTVNSRSRYWDYKDSYAWTYRTTYRFFRIRDAF